MPEAVARLLLPGTLCDARVFASMLAQGASAGDAAPVRVADLHSLRADPGLWWSQQLDGLPGCIDLIGFSLGGILAMQLLALQPQRVRRVALLASNAMAAHPELAQRVQAQQEFRQAHGARALAARMLQQASAGRVPQPTVLQCVQDMAETTPAPAFEAQCQLNAGRPDGLPALKAWSGPLMLISGDADPWCGADKQQRMLAARPDALWHELPDTGHYLPLERPHELARLCADFFNASAPCTAARTPRKEP